MISDLQPGPEVPDGEDRVRRFDYRHLLPPAAPAGLRLVVRESRMPGFGTYLYVRLYRGPHMVGCVDAVLEDDRGGALVLEASNLQPQYRGQGIGTAMYEAVLAHAYHRHGCRQAVGHGHSPLAHRVHLRLAERHGTGYVAKYWGSMKQWDEYRHRLA